MGLLDKLKKKNTVDNYDDKLRSLVVYNTRYNLILLLSYGPDHFYDVLDFIGTINNMNEAPVYKLTVLLSNTAVETPIEENEESFDKKTVKLINNKYYALISGTPEAYAKLYDYIDLSNEVLSEITKDIYNNCDSSKFKYLIDANVLTFGNFRYKNVMPKYDRRAHYNNTLNLNTNEYDDVAYILSKIPNTYSRLDLCKIIMVDYAQDPKNNYPMSAATVVYKALLYKDGDNGFFKVLFDLLCDNLFQNIVDNPSLDTLAVMHTPIYLREDETEEALTADLPVDKLDEMFQQEYERFNDPTYGSGVEYEEIDERIEDNDNTNM